MSKYEKQLTIVIAVFNSSKLLPKVFSAIEKQSFPKSKMEILVMDGGSTDRTVQLAKEFGAHVINNPRTEPVYAKYLGYIKAKAKYIIYLDHDEVFENLDSLQLKYTILEKENVKAVIGSGYKNPRNYSFINEYINEFGDPFSFYIYRLSKGNGFFIEEMKKRYKIIRDTRNFTIFDLFKTTKIPLIELCAGGSMFNAQYMKENFPDTLKKPELIPHFFYLMNSKKVMIAITKNDAIYHYSSDNVAKYINKIKWRIKNNIFHIKNMGVSGFTGRLKYQPKSDMVKQFLYPLYVFLLIPPLLDSFYLAITRKKILYFIHWPLTIYTGGAIIYYYILKFLGINLVLKSYDETKIINK